MHVTINYRGNGLEVRRMEQIGCMIGEILPVESVVGKGQHVERGRCPLCTAPG